MSTEYLDLPKTQRSLAETPQIKAKKKSLFHKRAKAKERGTEDALSDALYERKSNFSNQSFQRINSATIREAKLKRIDPSDSERDVSPLMKSLHILKSVKSFMLQPITSLNQQIVIDRSLSLLALENHSSSEQQKQNDLDIKALNEFLLS